MRALADLFDFYRGKKVLVTGHTGFKGTWMCKLLTLSGAKVVGYALQPSTSPNLYELSKMCDCKTYKGELSESSVLLEKSADMFSIFGDIRDLERLKKVFEKFEPEIVIHMAAQPLVRRSYEEPVYTYEVNVMGTVNVLECIRQCSSVRSFVNVTTDKVYKNKEWYWGYREDEELNGYDPYSNSKSCSELVTDSYKNSFLKERNIAISTVRAGNVIGGGDFAADRIIPDCLRAAETGKAIIVRNPYSVRPYEHVLEPIAVYLMIAKEQYRNAALAGNYNVGPEEIDCLTTGQLATLFCEKWKAITGQEIRWESKYDGGPHEAGYLKLDCSKLKSVFSWKPRWDMDVTMEKIVEWSWWYMQKGDLAGCMKRQIEEFLGEIVEQ